MRALQKAHETINNFVFSAGFGGCAVNNTCGCTLNDKDKKEVLNSC